MPAISLPDGLLAAFLRAAVKPVLGPPFPIGFQRFWMAFVSLFNPSAAGVRRQPDRLGGVPCLSLTPISLAPARQAPVVLYLHGGAFVLGSRRTHQSLASFLARRIRGEVHLVEYRLAPEHPWPAGADDALAAYRELLARGVDPRRIVIAGDSAGGAMTADLLLALRDGAGPLPAGGVMLSPAVGLDMERPAGAGAKDTYIRRDWAGQVLGGYRRPTHDPRHRILGRDLTGLPPIHLQYSEGELLAAECQSFAEELRRAGALPEVKIASGAFHVLALLAGIQARAREAVRDAGAFICRRVQDAHLASGAQGAGTSAGGAG